MTDYRIEPTGSSPEHIERYATFLSSVFTDTPKYTPEYLTWQYRDNPRGDVVGVDAWAGEELAAHYVTLPVRYRADGEEVPGLLSLNTATHPDHQGKGLFTRLAEATYQLGAERGYRFVIGVANENSTGGFLKKLGFALLGPLEVKVGLGHVARDTARPTPLACAWDAPTLAWRLTNPARDYRRHDRTLYTDAGRFGIQAIVALDKDLDALPAGRRPLRSVWIGLDPARRLRGLYAGLPDRLRPSPLNAILRPLDEGFPSFGTGDVRIELLDFDVY